MIDITDRYDAPAPKTVGGMFASMSNPVAGMPREQAEQIAASLGDGTDMGSWRTMSGEQFLRWWAASNKDAAAEQKQPAAAPEEAASLPEEAPEQVSAGLGSPESSSVGTVTLHNMPELNSDPKYVPGRGLPDL